MSSRNTDIIAEELDDINSLEDQKDQLFSILKSAILQERRLLLRFYQFATQYNEYEYDEMGINMEEAEDLIRKANKIRDKFLVNIESHISNIVEKINSDILNRTIIFDILYNNNLYKVKIKAEEDSFELEVWLEEK